MYRMWHNTSRAIYVNVAQYSCWQKHCCGEKDTRPRSTWAKIRVQERKLVHKKNLSSSRESCRKVCERSKLKGPGDFTAATTWVSGGRRMELRGWLKRGQRKVDRLKECRSPAMEVKVRKGKCEEWAVHEKGADAMSAIGQMRNEDATEVVEAQTETVMKRREDE